MFCVHPVQHGCKHLELNDSIAFACIVRQLFYRRFTSVPVFLLGSSFVHYGIYIATYYFRPQKMAYLAFKNTVVTFKVVALLQLARIYVSNFTFNPVSLALIATGQSRSLFVKVR